MSDRYRKSYEIFENAKRIFPGGVAKARLPHVPGRYPVYMDRAQGSHVWDVDGNEYVDWMSGYGCILLGHAFQEVDAAACAQMKKGFISLLSNPIQNELAQMLVEMVPCAEMVRFFKTGTDATTAAVRIARIHTGRDMVVRWGYHGWADWSLSTMPEFNAGVPQSTRELVHTFRYNDLDSLRAAFERHPGRIACQIMMPFETELPKEGFLEGARDICHEHGAVFVFDEIRSGFRMAPGGAQEYFGVVPDVAALSKAMANGYAISAVVGRRDVMTAVEKGLFSATFFSSAMEMAASIATLGIVRERGVIEHIWRIGAKLQAGLRDLCAASPLGVEVVGAPPMPFLQFRESDREAKMEFYAEAAERGVYFHPGHHWFVNFSHTDEDVERTLDACRRAFEAAAAVRPS